MQETPLSKSPFVLFTRSEWLLIFFMASVSSILGVIGFYIYYEQQQANATALDILYSTIGLFILEFNGTIGKVPGPLEVARWLAPISLSYAAFKAVMSIMGNRLAQFKINRLKNHAIICGLDEKSLQTITSLRAANIPTVVIVNTLENHHTGLAREQGAHIIHGNPGDVTQLTLANIRNAAYLLATTMDDERNIEITYHAFRQRREQLAGPVLQCIAHIKQQHLIPILYDQPVFSKDYDYFSARIVNYSAIAARLLLSHYGPERELSTLQKKSDLSVLLVGNHDFIDDIVLRFASIGHYGNSHPVNISIVGKSANERLQKIIEDQPILTEIVNLQANNLDLNIIHAAKNQKVIDDFNPDIIYICASSTELTLAWTQLLLSFTTKIPIIINDFNNSVITSVMSENFEDYPHVKLADKLHTSTSFDAIFNATHDKMARAIHENYVNVQVAAGDNLETNSSLIDWQHLPESLKDANRNQADHMAIKCRLLSSDTPISAAAINDKLTVDMIEHLSKIEHERWVAEKLITGWRYSSGEKNTALRLSPNLIPWDDLTDTEREKDRDTVKNLPQLAHMLEGLST